MPPMLPVQGLPEPVDDAVGVDQPPQFADSPEHERAAIPSTSRRTHPISLTSSSHFEGLP